MRLMNYLMLGLTALLVSANPAFAADAAAGGQDGLAILGAGLGLGLAAMGGAFGQGKLISSTVDAIGRNPGAAGQMFLAWILGLVFIESLVIYALVVALKLLP